jgi:hypothetical protein
MLTSIFGMAFASSPLNPAPVNPSAVNLAPVNSAVNNINHNGIFFSTTDYLARYEIAPIVNHDGIYFKEFGTLHEYDNTWEIHFTINTKDLSSQLKSIKANVNRACEIIKLSTQYKKPNVSTIDICATINDEIDDYSDRLELFFNDQPKEKRGLINLGGKLYKWLFGLMDNGDRKEILANIDELVENQEYFRHFHNETASVVKSLVNDYTKFKNITTAAIKALETGFYNTSGADLRIELTIHCEEVINVMFFNFNIVKDKITSIFNIMTTKKMNPTLIQPKFVRNILTNISSSLPINNFLPFNVNQIRKYYEFMDLHHTINDNFIVLSTFVPILAINQKADIYKVMPLPIKINNTEAITILDVKDDLFAINPLTNEHQLLDTASFSKCISDEETSNYFCPRENNFNFNYNNNLNDCIFNKFKKIHDKNCKEFFMIFKFDELIFYRLNNDKWLFICPKANELLGFCDQDNIFKISIENMGILKLNKNCRAKGAITLNPSHVSEEIINLNLTGMHLEEINSWIDGIDIKNAMSIPKFNFSLENFNSASVLKSQADDLRKDAVKPLFHRIKNNKDLLFTVIILIIIIIVLIVIFILMIYFYCKMNPVKNATQYLATRMLERYLSIAQSINGNR